ncbi:fungal-specific transcription factor domain-containing protein [Xylogone sp. PMI_703]|nr:fungal-specific transcription factor domain-containing protein [Xylogone sp. PMI_703]
MVCPSSPVKPNAPKTTINPHFLYNNDPIPHTDIAQNPNQAEMKKRIRESYLLMHYLDEIFYIQFPFNIPRSSHRGILYSMLLDNKTFFYSSLSLSAFEREAYTQQLSPSQKDHVVRTDILSESNSYLSTALEELRHNFPRLCSGHNDFDNAGKISTVACMIQLVFLEGGSALMPHLQAAAQIIKGLIPSIFGRFHEHLSAAPSGDVDHGQEHVRHSSGHGLPASKVDREATLRYIGVLIWLDILLCSSNRTAAPLLGDYHDLLLDESVDISCISWCQNWVALQLSRVSSLDARKRQLETAGALSIMELTRRAIVIEEDIKSGLKNLDGLSGAVANFTSEELSDISLITRIFALSTIVYLHVVISGPLPELQEIKDCVSQAIQELTQIALEKPQLLPKLVWPICVNGCLALCTQESTIKEILNVLSTVRPHITGSKLMVSQIIEDCWKSRKCESRVVLDWRTAAEDLNHLIFFI